MSQSNFTNSFKENINSTSGKSVITALMILEHQDLSFPIRITQNNEDIISNGERYTSCYFEFTPYADIENQAPSASITIDNVGLELSRWIDRSNGAKNLKFTVHIIETSDPDYYQSSMTARLINISMTSKKISATISLEDIINKKAVERTFSEKYTSGLF